MTKEVLKIISDDMESLGLNYECMEWTSDPVYPYFVGEYSENPSLTEDGLQESSFIITGFARGKRIDLEDARSLIMEHYNQIYGSTSITESGSGVAIFYSNSFPVQTGDSELKRIQINLTIKEWKVDKK